MRDIDIKIARIRAGLKQYKVAIRVGIPPNRLSEIESGRHQPSSELVERIFRVIKGSGDVAKEAK
jgi:transcriptional regulator with XRE-family HTH domain